MKSFCEYVKKYASNFWKVSLDIQNLYFWFPLSLPVVDTEHSWPEKMRDGQIDVDDPIGLLLLPHATSLYFSLLYFAFFLHSIGLLAFTCYVTWLFTFVLYFFTFVHSIGSLAIVSTCYITYLLLLCTRYLHFGNRDVEWDNLSATRRGQEGRICEKPGRTNLLITVFLMEWSAGFSLSPTYPEVWSNLRLRQNLQQERRMRSLDKLANHSLPCRELVSACHQPFRTKNPKPLSATGKEDEKPGQTC